jgi:acetate---CoA ligase (ADP-forming)
MKALERLFNPKSIAVVGASPDESKAGYQMLYSLKDFPGMLYPINPRADNILGFKAYPNLKAIGHPVDLVVLTIPAAACVNVLKEAGESGAGSALIISGGFSETGGDVGRKMQKKILSVCQRFNIRLLGPNTAGFVNPWSKVVPNFNPWTAEISEGHIGLVSQSGAMCLTLASMIHAQNLGVSLATGIGNGADVNVSDAVEYLADDPKTKVIMLYLEGIRDGRRLYDIINRTTPKKPVLVLAMGKGDIAEFAASHTGNIIGSYEVKIAALKQAGAVILESSDDLVDAANLLSRVRLRPKKDPGVGLLTGQAGPGMVIADCLRSRNVKLPELHSLTVDKIRRVLPPLTFIRNPVDTSRPGETFPDVLNAISDDPSIDVLAVFALCEPAVIDPISIFRDAVNIKQPIVFGTAGIKEEIDATIKSLSKLNIAAFSSPDRAAKAVYALIEDSKAAYRKTESTANKMQAIRIDPLSHDPDEDKAKDILNEIGIPTPKRFACKSREEAKDAFRSLRKPVVAKILHESIHHKTDVGGVILDIKNEGLLEYALNRIDTIITGNGRRYLLEETANDGLEVIIGAKNDPSFGPAVMVGLGGVAAEALDDATMRMAPLSLHEAIGMILELRSSALFEGWRGATPLDVNFLAESLVRIGQFMFDHPEIKEMDLNPVRVYEKGISALDALILVKHELDENFQ